MQYAKCISLVLYNANAVWELYLTYRQYRCVTKAKDVPLALQANITQEQFEKANAYSRDRLIVSAASTVLDAIVTNVTLSYDLLPELWYGTLPSGSSLEGGLWHCVAFFCVADVIETIIELPISYYSTFYVEAKHGFNKQTKSVFFLDKLKYRLLHVAVSVPIMAGVLKILDSFGPQFPMYLGGFLTGTSLLFSVIYPTFIQPLFNTFTPLPEGPLQAKIESLAKKIRFPLTRIYIVDGSTRSSHSNAYFYGIFNKRIVIYDTLLNQMKEHDQCLLAVLAHEFGHWKLRHTLVQLTLGVGQVFAICYGAQTVVYNTAVYKSFGFDSTPRFIGLLLFFLVFMTPVDAVLTTAVTAVIRLMEFQADRFSTDMGFGDDLQKALLLMREHNSMTVVHDRLYAACKYTHPPLLQRIAAIREHMRATKTF